MENQTIKPRGLAPSDVLISATGGTLDIVSSAGEILAEIHVPAGRHRASVYTELLGPGEVLQVGDGLVAFRRPPLGSVTVYPDEINRASDANPDWKPTLASEHERRLRVLLIRRREESTRTDRRAAAQASLEGARKRAEEALTQERADAEAAATATAAEAQAAADILAKALAKATAVVE